MSRTEAKPKHYRATTYLSWIEDEALICHLQARGNEAGALRHLARLGLQAIQLPALGGETSPVTPAIKETLEQILRHNDPDLLRQIVTAAISEALSQLEISPAQTGSSNHLDETTEEANLDALLL